MAYCDKYGLTEAQKTAIKRRDVLGLIAEIWQYLLPYKFTSACWDSTCKILVRCKQV
ncbi:hypothetical protein OK016_28190 [Vibrio chagasii]|nr:hypothetical protein [Vibrio chagasii]